jgi:hypothetical protein
MGLLSDVTFSDTISAHDLCQGVKMLVEMLALPDCRLDKTAGMGYKTLVTGTFVAMNGA